MVTSFSWYGQIKNVTDGPLMSPSPMMLATISLVGSNYGTGHTHFRLCPLISATLRLDIGLADECVQGVSLSQKAAEEEAEECDCPQSCQ